MKSNLPSTIPSLPAGKYWVCDPALIFDYGEMHDAFVDGEMESGIYIYRGEFRCVFLDTEMGPGAFAFEQCFNGCAESETGYIGVFPDSFIRFIRRVTEMKKMKRHGVIAVEMDEEFDVTKIDYRVDIGRLQLTKVRGI